MGESATSRPVEGAALRMWQRLKGRTVVQWTLAYIALAYSLLHGVELIGHGFDWPHIVYRIATVLLIAGVPVASVVAWYHGDRARGRVSGPEVSILILLLVIAGTVLWIAARTSAEHEDQRAATPSASAAPAIVTPPASVAEPPRASIAVVPFANLTGDPGKEYLSDGMADELINTLASVPGLRVPARMSSFAYKGRNTDVREIARDLGVGAVLEGSVRSAGERIRVTAQLVDARTGYHLWSQSYDRKLTDLFNLQDELTTAIVQAINARMNGSLTAAARGKAPTDDVQAYESYLQAVEFAERPSADSLRQSIEMFEQAIERDPEFTRALTGKAFALITSILTGNATGPVVRESLAEAARVAERAIALDPNLAGAHVALGAVSSLRGRPVDAEPHFRAAFALDNDDPMGHRFYALFVLARTGQMRRALEETHKAYALAPASVSSITIVAAANSGIGRDKEALERINLAMKFGVSPNIPPYPLIRANAAARAGRYSEAARYIIDGTRAGALTAEEKKAIELAYAALGAPGKRPAAIAALQSLQSNLDTQALGPPAGILFASWYTQLGDVDLAYDTLERFLAESMQAGTVGMEWQWCWIPELRAFRQDPRFDALTRKLGFVEYWEKYGPPDECELREGKVRCR